MAEDILSQNAKRYNTNKVLVDYALTLPEKQIEIFSKVTQKVQPTMTEVINEYVFPGMFFKSRKLSLTSALYRPLYNQ